MEEKEFDDNEFYKIISIGRRTMPFDDFEDKVMHKIHYKYSHMQAIANKLKLSLICFIAGTVAGIALTLLISGFEYSIFGLKIRTLALPVLFLIALVGIMSLDNFLRLIKKYSG